MVNKLNVIKHGKIYYKDVMIRKNIKKDLYIKTVLLVKNGIIFRTLPNGTMIIFIL